MNNQKQMKSNSYKCVNCGGNLIYFPSTKMLKCENCNSDFLIENNFTFSKHLINQTIERNQEYSDYVNANKMFRCTNCGSSVILNNREISSVCPYCDSPMAVDNSQINFLKPDAIIPFSFDKNVASQKFKEGINKKFFIPNKFKKNIPSGEIHGLYLPTFSFDAKVKASYSGRLSVEEGSGEDTVVRQFNISGVKEAQYNDIVCEASSLINQSVFDTIKPYDFNELKPYKNEYILGYSVECYDSQMTEKYEYAKRLMYDYTKNSILKEYDYTNIISFNMFTEFSNELYSYYILPSYEVKYKYKDKMYRTFMNGQTGKVGGGVPRSGLKIFFFILTILLIIGGIAVLCNL